MIVKHVNRAFKQNNGRNISKIMVGLYTFEMCDMLKLLRNWICTNLQHNANRSSQISGSITRSFIPRNQFTNGSAAHIWAFSCLIK
jgi:hypothetical protein